MLNINETLYNLPLDNPDVWQLICDGYTKGIFQLDSWTGHKWSKKLQPRSINELSDLIAIVRPGTADIIIDGKSLTQHFVDRKHGIEEVSYTVPALELVLKNTYGILVYQEQAILIAQKIAGFDLVNADKLRKAIGTKDAAIMASLEEDFIKGCIKVGLVNEEEAKLIFNQIRASQRYSFNACLSLDTIVITKNGYKTLSELIIGDYILAPNNDFTDNEYVEVTDVINTKEQEIFLVTLESGLTIQCTIDHKFLCDDGNIHTLYEIINNNYKIMCKDNIKKTIMRSENIVSIKSLGYKPTLDITVNNKHHLYYGNYFITSNSHACSYSITSYWTAYLKHLCPIKFFLHYLRHAKDKMKPKIEIKELIVESKKMGIQVKLPSIHDFIRLNQTDFYIENDIIYFGLNNVKGIGDSKIKTLYSYLTNNSTEWIDILFSNKIDKKTIINLVSVGFFGPDRKKKLHDYSLVSRLTDRELSLSKGLSFEDRINSLFDHGNKNRKIIYTDILKLYKEPAQDLSDDLTWIYETECEILGCGISCNKTDTVNVDIDTRCCDILIGQVNKCSVVLEISNPKEYTIKNGKNVGKLMGAFSGSDETGTINCLMFGDTYEKYKNKIYDEAVVIATGKKNNKNDFIIDVLEIA